MTLSLYYGSHGPLRTPPHYVGSHAVAPRQHRTASLPAGWAWTRSLERIWSYVSFTLVVVLSTKLVQAHSSDQERQKAMER